jgi:hypothetical protein
MNKVGNEFIVIIVKKFYTFRNYPLESININLLLMVNGGFLLTIIKLPTKMEI